MTLSSYLCKCSSFNALCDTINIKQRDKWWILSFWIPCRWNTDRVRFWMWRSSGAETSRRDGWITVSDICFLQYILNDNWYVLEYIYIPIITSSPNIFFNAAPVTGFRLTNCLKKAPTNIYWQYTCHATIVLNIDQYNRLCVINKGGHP